MEKFKKFAFLVAQGCEYETDYDGRTYICCAYCGKGLNDELQHEEDCSMLEAQKALGDEWTKYKEEKEQCLKEENKFRVRKYDLSWNKKVRCDICGKIVAESGLRQHKKSSHFCKMPGEL